MSIKELIDLLSRFNGNKKVVIETPEGDLMEDVIVNEGFDGEIVIQQF